MSKQAKPFIGSTAWEDLQADLATRAGKDENFRQALLKDPKGVLGQEMTKLGKEMGTLPEDKKSVDLPDSMKVVVLEQTGDTLYLIIPPSMAAGAGDGELSVEQLEAVAGGKPGDTYDTCDYTVCALTIPGSCDCVSW